MAGEPEHRPQGALLQDDGSVVWRVWAPLAETVSLVTWRGDLPDSRPHPDPLPAGEGTIVPMTAGRLWVFRLPARRRRGRASLCA